MQQGKVKFFKKDKGFGFLVPTEGSSEGEVFFHESQAVKGYQPQEGDNVIFDLGYGRDGRTSATKVAPFVVKENNDDWDYDYDALRPSRKQEREEREREERKREEREREERKREERKREEREREEREREERKREEREREEREREEREREEDKLIQEYRSASLSKVNKDILQEFNENPELLISISLKELEILVAKLMEDMGYIVSFIEYGTDGERYIVADYVLPSNDTFRTIVECHKYDPTKEVDGRIIKNFLFVIERENFAHKGWIVTNTSFSSEALKYAYDYSWELSLKDNHDLRKYLSDYSNKQNKSDSGFYVPKHEFLSKNPKQDKINYLNELLKKGELEICLEEFWKIALKHSPKLCNYSISAAGRLTELEESFRVIREISFKEYTLERNRIRESVLWLKDLIFELPFY